MDNKYFNSLCEMHRSDSNEALLKIVNNPRKYSQEAVCAAKLVLEERNLNVNNSDSNSNGNSNDNSKNVVNNIFDNNKIMLDSIDRNINTIKNVLVFWSTLTIILFIIVIINL